MLVYCVRHGESAFNAEGRIQGQIDVPLSETGRRQGRALAAALRGAAVDAVISSPLARAYETAVPIADVLELSVQTDDRLKELNAGVFQGLLHAEMETQYPREYACWKSGDPDYCMPQGESRRALMTRAAAAFEDLRQQPYQRVVVVGHGGALTAALKQLLGIPADRNPFMLYNASISRLEASSCWRLLTLNETEHLRTPDGKIESRLGDL